MEEPVCLILSMENSLSPTYKGGLGILMEDYFHQAYEENYPLIFVSLLYPCKLTQIKYNQTSEVKSTKVANNLLDTGKEIKINSNWYPIKLRVFEYPSKSRAKAFFLSPDLDENPQWLRELEVYGEKDSGQLLFTRYLLGEGSIELAKMYGIDFDILHLQESDTALAIRPALELKEKISIVLTIHTPLPHGHKFFFKNEVESLYGKIPKEFEPGIRGNFLYLTDLASHYADKIYTVSKMQESVEKSRLVQHAQKISSISNCVHKRWINKHLKKLFDEEIVDWKENVWKLKDIVKISDEKIEKALVNARKDLEEKFDFWNGNGEVVSNFSSISSEARIFTFAKRITEYKRQKDFLRIAKEMGQNSVCIFSGPLIGNYGEEFLKEFLNSFNQSKIAYILNFDEEKAHYLVSGSDFWLNIPRVWDEASGTSHMKASVNGRLVISTPAGTVPEYMVDGYNGIIVKDNLEDLPQKVKQCENLTQEEYLRISKNCISSSPYILMDKMFEEYANEYKTLVKQSSLFPHIVSYQSNIEQDAPAGI